MHHLYVHSFSAFIHFFLKIFNYSVIHSYVTLFPPLHSFIQLIYAVCRWFEKKERKHTKIFRYCQRKCHKNKKQKDAKGENLLVHVFFKFYLFACRTCFPSVAHFLSLTLPSSLCVSFTSPWLLLFSRIKLNNEMTLTNWGQLLDMFLFRKVFIYHFFS